MRASVIPGVQFPDAGVGGFGLIQALVSLIAQERPRRPARAMGRVAFRQRAGDRLLADQTWAVVAAHLAIGGLGYAGLARPCRAVKWTREALGRAFARVSRFLGLPLDLRLVDGRSGEVLDGDARSARVDVGRWAVAWRVVPESGAEDRDRLSEAEGVRLGPIGALAGVVPFDPDQARSAGQ
jgi:hypothetical protein